MTSSIPQIEPGTSTSSPTILTLSLLCTSLRSIGQNPSTDKWIWVPSPSVKFTVKSAHDLANNFSHIHSGPSPEDWKQLRNLKLQHRLKHLIWEIFWNILLVMSNIFKFSPAAVQNDACCPLCHDPQETIRHIHLSCCFARIKWRNIRWPYDTSVFGPFPIADWIKAFLRPHSMLAIPKKDLHDFQVTTVVAMDKFGLPRTKTSTKIPPLMLIKP